MRSGIGVIDSGIDVLQETKPFNEVFEFGLVVNKTIKLMVVFFGGTIKEIGPNELVRTLLELTPRSIYPNLVGSRID